MIVENASAGDVSHARFLLADDAILLRVPTGKLSYSTKVGVDQATHKS